MHLSMLRWVGRVDSSAFAVHYIHVLHGVGCWILWCDAHMLENEMLRLCMSPKECERILSICS